MIVNFPSLVDKGLNQDFQCRIVYYVPSIAQTLQILHDNLYKLLIRKLPGG